MTRVLVIKIKNVSTNSPIRFFVLRRAVLDGLYLCLQSLFWRRGVLADTDDPEGVLREVKESLSRAEMASLSELEQSLRISRNWLSGFMSALVAVGMVECRGTRTYKLYMWRSQQEHLFKIERYT